MSRNVDSSKKNEQILSELLKIESNKYCADCGQKGTRWASWNIGVFLCIRCGGLHRSLGTHISKVKSVTLDKWTDDQIESIKSKGNAKVNILYNSHPDKHPFPTFSGDMENYIRDKYERKLFMTDSNESAPLSLKSNSTDKPRANLLDSDRLFEFDGSNDFKKSDYTDANYSKQLTLLSEMGFTDSEFNYKTLKASNGNMQEALEIIVASNQKSKRKSSERNINIFDEIQQEFSPVASNSNIQSTDSFQVTPPIQLEEWGFDSTPVALDKKESKESVQSSTKSESVPEVKNNSNNPWDDNHAESEKEIYSSKKSNDPFDTYKAFSSNTNDAYFDNPW